MAAVQVVKGHASEPSWLGNSTTVEWDAGKKAASAWGEDLESSSPISRGGQALEDRPQGFNMAAAQAVFADRWAAALKQPDVVFYSSSADSKTEQAAPAATPTGGAPTMKTFSKAAAAPSGGHFSRDLTSRPSAPGAREWARPSAPHISSGPNGTAAHAGQQYNGPMKPFGGPRVDRGTPLPGGTPSGMTYRRDGSNGGAGGMMLGAMHHRDNSGSAGLGPHMLGGGIGGPGGVSSSRNLSGGGGVPSAVSGGRGPTGVWGRGRGRV